MKFILKYDSFLNEAFLEKDKEKAISLILSYIGKNTEIDFYPYDEIWNIQKDDVFLKGYLFLSLKTKKALRFNWIQHSLSSELHSIDLWLSFEFDTNPQYTLDINGMSVASILPGVVDFINNPQSVMSGQKPLKEELTGPSKEELEQQLSDEEKRLKRLKNPERIEIQKKKVEFLKATIAKSEKSSTDSEKVNQLDDDLNIEVFKSIELYTIQVAKGKSNSLIITGDSGVGKTQTVRDTLETMGLKEDEDYYFATGTATTAGLYELLFRNRDSLIVFDDCDSVFKEADSINLLKGALDTYRKRSLAKLTKGNTFDSTGMSDEDMESEFRESGKYPNKFGFVGRIIFVSNLPEDAFDKALISRSLHVDVHLSKQELFERMKEIMKKLSPDVPYEAKLEALEYLTQIVNSYPTKFDLNIRTLIHSINLRANNEGEMQIGNRQEAIWKLLVKKYLIKTR